MSMEEKKSVSHFSAGVIIAAIMVVFSLVMSFAGQGQNQALGWLAYVIFILALIYFINQYGKANGNELSFGNLFNYGFKTTSIVTLIVIVFLVLFFSFFPEYKDKMLDSSRIAMEKQGRISEEQLDETLSMMNKNFILFAGAGALFMYLLLGAVGSLIGAAVTKKITQNSFDQSSL